VNGDIDVFASTSKDRGKHWAPAVRVNSDSRHNGHDQFFQWLAVDPIDGSVNIVFCDRRADPENRKYVLVLARSTDGGRTFQNYAWSTKPSDPKDIFMGDYMGIAAAGGRVYGIWARTALPEEWPPAEKTEAPKDQNSAVKPSDEGKAAKQGEDKAVLKMKGLLIEIGLADFTKSPKAAEIK
jgi:hypothetical protein